MAVYRVWREVRAVCYYVDTSSAVEAVEAVARLFPDASGWRAEPDTVNFIVDKNVVVDRDGNPCPSTSSL